jgi:hypothetical protein
VLAKLKINSFRAIVVVIFLFLGSSQAIAARINTVMVDGLKIQSSTRVQAGKLFQVKITSGKNKINGICWMNWQLSKGFSIPREFKMKNGMATVKLLPIEPGAGTMDFSCGMNRSTPQAGGSTQIYIAP